MDKVLKRIIFDLNIKLPNLEFKKPKVNIQNSLVKDDKIPQSLKDVFNITIQDFLDVDDKMANTLKKIFFVKHYLDLEKLIIDEVIIKGEINGLMEGNPLDGGIDPAFFNIEDFVESLKKVPKNFNCEADWDGYFEEISPPYDYVYKSPEFTCKEKGFFDSFLGVVSLTVLLLIFLSSSDIDNESSQSSIERYIAAIEGDYCYPDCDNPSSALKLNSDGTFNSSSTFSGGMSRWGNWEKVDNDKLKLITTRISTNSNSDKIPPPQTIYIMSNGGLKIGSTIHIKG